MSHTVGAGLPTNFVWDINSGLPQVLRETAGTSTATYVYGPGLISSTDQSGNQTYYTSDGLGSTADLTDASAVKTDGYTYDVFGTATHSPGGSTQPFQFTGQQTDTETQLQYLRARYYDMGAGRFLSTDPIRSGNPYGYAANNPANLVDPLGLAEVPGNGGMWCLYGSMDDCRAGGGVGGGGGGVGILIIEGIVVVVGGGVATGIEIGDRIGTVFSGGGKSDASRLKSIKNLSIDLHTHLCYAVRGSSVQTEIAARLRAIKEEYEALGPSKLSRAEDIFRKNVWEKPCQFPGGAPFLLGEKVDKLKKNLGIGGP